MKKILMGNREENPLKSVAQKICNINIKGDNNTHKYKKSYENIKKLKNNISDDIHFDNTNDNEFEIEEDSQNNDKDELFNNEEDENDEEIEDKKKKEKEEKQKK